MDGGQASDRVLVLVGGNLTVALGTVKTDAEGTFSAELAIPGYLPSGSYELQAIGDETLSTTLDVTAAAGSLVLAFVAIAAGLGLLLVWRAERFRGTATS